MIERSKMNFFYFLMSSNSFQFSLRDHPFDNTLNRWFGSRQYFIVLIIKDDERRTHI